MTWPAQSSPFGGDMRQEREDTRLSLEVSGALDAAVKHRQRAAVAKWGLEISGLSDCAGELERIVNAESSRAVDCLRDAARALKP